MQINKELSETIDPILAAETEDWWELAAIAGLSPAQLEEELELSPEDEQPILRECLDEYKRKLRAVIRTPEGETTEGEDDIFLALWKLKIAPRNEFEQRVSGFLARNLAPMRLAADPIGARFQLPSHPSVELARVGRNGSSGGSKMQEYEDLKALVAEIEADIEKVEGGNKAAGTLVRKQMKKIMQVAQTVRNRILKIKHAS